LVSSIECSNLEPSLSTASIITRPGTTSTLPTRERRNPGTVRVVWQGSCSLRRRVAAFLYTACITRGRGSTTSPRLPARRPWLSEAAIRRKVSWDICSLRLDESNFIFECFLPSFLLGLHIGFPFSSRVFLLYGSTHSFHLFRTYSWSRGDCSLLECSVQIMYLYRILCLYCVSE